MILPESKNQVKTKENLTSAERKFVEDMVKGTFTK